MVPGRLISCFSPISVEYMMSLFQGAVQTFALEDWCRRACPSPQNMTVNREESKKDLQRALQALNTEKMEDLARFLAFDHDELLPSYAYQQQPLAGVPDGRVFTQSGKTPCARYVTIRGSHDCRHKKTSYYIQLGVWGYVCQKRCI